MVGGQEPIRKEVARMNDIYSTMHKLTADLIETAYPAENEGEISPVSLKCEIAKGNVTYYVTNERNSKGNYESTVRADTEDEAILEEKRNIIKIIENSLSDLNVIKDIKDGEVTVVGAAREALQVYEVLPEVLEEIRNGRTSEPAEFDEYKVREAFTSDFKTLLTRLADSYGLNVECSISYSDPNYSKIESLEIDFK